MKGEKRIWLVTSKHLEGGVWFPEESDFKVGMNYVAALAAFMGVEILAFVLMSNHVHFVLLCTEDEAVAFINELKRRYGKDLQHKHGIVKLLKRNSVDVREVPFDNEAPEKAIAYVQMNPVAANICLYPSQYPWGTGKLFFAADKLKGIRADSISKRARFRMFCSKTDIPGNWLICEDGYILPSSYVKVDYVEKLFRQPSRMSYFLNNSSKAKIRLVEEDSHPAFRDQIMIAALPDICRSLFQKVSFKDLSEPQQIEVLRQMRYRFSSNAHQLARVTGLTYDAAAKLLDSH